MIQNTYNKKAPDLLGAFNYAHKVAVEKRREVPMLIGLSIKNKNNREPTKPYCSHFKTS